jgi:hypothetical protein
MEPKTISANDFLAGLIFPDRIGIDKHNLKAELVGRGIVVKDASGNVVKVIYAGSTDNRTLYARVEGLGFIGGWQYPHRRAPFTDLVESINQGVLYHDMNDLPNGRKRKV